MSVSGELSAGVRVIQPDYAADPPRADEVLSVEITPVACYEIGCERCGNV